MNNKRMAYEYQKPVHVGQGAALRW